MKTVFYVRGAIVIALMLTTLAVGTHAQAQSFDEEIFAAIPAESRMKLIERLDLYVTSQRTADYDKLYDLYSQKTISQVFKGQSKTEFLAAFRKVMKTARVSGLLSLFPSG